MEVHKLRSSYMSILCPKKCSIIWANMESFAIAESEIGP